MKRKPHCYATKQQGHDFADAETRFGEVHVIFDRDFSPFKMRTAREIVEEELDKNPPQSTDFVILSGPPSLSLVLVDHILARTESIRLLIFHAKDRVYVERDMIRAKHRPANDEEDDGVHPE